LVNSETNKALTQREYPRMALIFSKIIEGSDEESSSLVINAPGMEELVVPFSDFEENVEEVSIWKDKVMAGKYKKQYSQWFSNYLGLNVDLVFMPVTSNRQIDLKYSQEGSFVSFADGYPLLLATEHSVNHINDQIANPIDMRRFRPNIVVSVNTDKPFPEDNWKVIKIGDIFLDLVKPCDRCVLTTVNPDEGKKSKDGEPLRILSKIHKMGGSIIFGKNAIPRSEGIISVGDEVYLIE